MRAAAEKIPVAWCGGWLTRKVRMQCSKGRSLAIGSVVEFTEWDESDPKKPVGSQVRGTVTKIEGARQTDDTIGQVTVKKEDKSEVTLEAGALTVITPEQLEAEAEAAEKAAKKKK